MNEFISSTRHAVAETRVGKAAMTLLLSGAILTACTSGETAPAATETPVATPTEVVLTPDQQCAIAGLEGLSFDDEACIIEPN